MNFNHTKFALLGLIFQLSFVSLSSAQTAPGMVWVQFANKHNSLYSLQQPSEYLSLSTINRRLKEGIGFDSLDLPVNPEYVSAMIALGNMELHHKSKWFNAATVRIVDTAMMQTTIDAIRALSFVADVKSVTSRRFSHEIDKEVGMTDTRSGGDVLEEEQEYGPSFRQISMLNGHLLHRLGYTGKGRKIAVFDAGWIRTDILPAFGHLYEEGRIVEIKDFVSPNEIAVYGKSTHGTFVLSHMAGLIPDSLIGTAPGASYYLFRTENVEGEYLVEEDNWVAAAEYADSIGVDLINSSLGYSLFDDPSMNHSYSDMNGQSTRSSIAAGIASRKGILVVNSAGNSGSSAWRYITAPSDGKGVMAVGSVNSEEQHSFFSSYGPASDGDVKPNVMTMGEQTVFADMDSTIRKGNGTSFSAPILTGLAACLWEAFPERSSKEIFRAIEQSAHLYFMPNDSMGHGIPDFWKAFEFLRSSNAVPAGELNVQVFPNPSNGFLSVIINQRTTESPRYEVRDYAGRLVLTGTGFTGPIDQDYYQGKIDVSSLSSGLYFLILDAGDDRSVLRFEKMTP